MSVRAAAAIQRTTFMGTSCIGRPGRCPGTAMQESSVRPRSCAQGWRSRRLPGAREDFPDRRERGLLRGRADRGHRYPIVTTMRIQLSAGSSRRYPMWAAAALLITLAGVAITAVALLQATGAPGDYRDGLLTSISYAVPYAVTGAFLIVRRPDLPFGWLLSGAALLAAVGSATAALVYLAVSHGASGRLVLLGYAMAATGIMPLAVQGLVNVRFPSGG